MNPQRWLIGLEDGAILAEEALTAAGLRLVERHRHEDGEVLLAEGNVSPAEIDGLRARAGVVYVEPDYEVA